MKPGHGEVLIAEGDVDVAEDEQRLIEEFRRQLDAGLVGGRADYRATEASARRGWCAPSRTSLGTPNA